MKLYEIKPSWRIETLNKVLTESVSDYLSLAIARLKSKKPEELFLPGSYAHDLDQLAEVIAGLKVLANAEHRDTLTKDDLGINPNSYADLYKLLQSIPRDSQNWPKLTDAVFKALKTIAPGIFKKTRQELEILKDGSSGERKELIAKIEGFAKDVNELFYKVKHGVTRPKGVEAPTDIEPIYHEVGGYPI